MFNKKCAKYLFDFIYKYTQFKIFRIGGVVINLIEKFKKNEHASFHEQALPNFRDILLLY